MMCEVKLHFNSVRARPQSFSNLRQVLWVAENVSWHLSQNWFFYKVEELDVAD